MELEIRRAEFGHIEILLAVKIDVHVIGTYSSNVHYVPE